MLYSVEATLTTNGVVLQKGSIYTLTIIVWCEILHVMNIDPFFFEDNLNRNLFLDFVK